MDPRGGIPPQPPAPGLVRRGLSADSPAFAPATAAAAVITTRAPMAYPASPPLASRARPQPIQPPPPTPQPTRRVAPPAPTPQPYPQAKPEIVLPAMVPRLTALLPLHELNIFLQASRRHLAAMEHTGALKALALRHPRENNNHNNSGGSGGSSSEKSQQQAPSQPQGQATDKQQQQQSPGASLDGDSGSGSGSGSGGTPTPLKVLTRFQRGLATLRLADRRVLPYLFLGVHQRLATGIVTLVLRDLNMADEDLIRLGVLLGKPWLLPSLQELYLGGRNRFFDAGLAAFAALGLNPTTASGAAATNPLNGAISGSPRGGSAAMSQQQRKVEPPALKLHTLDLGGNGLTASGQALEALAEAFGARSTLLLPPAPDSDDEGDNDKDSQQEAKSVGSAAGGGGGAGKGHGGVVGLRKLVLGQWCWGPRPALLAASSTATEEEAKAVDAIPSLHPLRQLLAAPAVAGTLEELDLLQARLLPGEIEALALALHNGAAASLYRRLRVLRLGLDPDAFAAAPAGAAAQATPSDDNADATAEANKDGTPPKQQEEQGRTAISAPTTTIKRTAATPLLPLLACLRDGACPRLTTLDLDARLTPPIKNKSKKNDNGAEAAASSTATTAAAPMVSPLTGEPLAALATALRQGQLRRLESVRLARCGLNANDLYLLLEAVHAATLSSTTTTTKSSSNQGGGSSKKKKAGVVGLRGLSVEGNPALGMFGVQVLALCIREGTLPQLQALNLDGAGGGDAGLRDLAHAFESLATTSKPLPLHALSLAGNAITAEGVAWLGRALTSGALPKLTSLSLADNPGMRKEGSRYFTTVLQHSPPAPCKLKTLDLRWTEMGVEGAEALAALIHAGACPALERLSLAQGPRTPWNPETRAALHKVRDALLARSSPGGGAFGAGASLTTNPDGTPVSAYVARRRAGAARRRAASGNGPRVTCL